MLSGVQASHISQSNKRYCLSPQTPSHILKPLCLQEQYGTHKRALLLGSIREEPWQQNNFFIKTEHI